MYVRPRLGFRQICTTFGLSLSDYIVCSFRHTLTHNRPRYLERRYLEPRLSRIPTISNPRYLESIPCYLQPWLSRVHPLLSPTRYLEFIPCYLQPQLSRIPRHLDPRLSRIPTISKPGYLESISCYLQPRLSRVPCYLEPQFSQIPHYI